MKPLEVINIELPEKFHSSYEGDWDANLSKGEWEKILLDHVRSVTKNKLKKYNITRMYLH